MESIVGLIPARGGSKGLPGKNIKLLAGKPMIAWSIEAALRAPEVHRVIVSTDDADIAACARQHGAEVPFIRPAPLASDTASSLEVALHALDWLRHHEAYQPEFLLLLQPTSPLRTAEDIQRGVTLQKEKNAQAVVSVCEAAHPPHWFRRIDAQGNLIAEASAVSVERRQDSGSLYQLNGALYLIRTPVLLRARTFLPEPTQAYIMPAERSVDVDTPFDFQVAELLLSASALRMPCPP